MFNQPKAAPAPGPPPRATKPHAFKWKTSSEKEQSGDSKTVNVKDVPAPAPTPTPTPGATSSSSSSIAVTGEPAAGEAEPLTETRPAGPARLPSGSGSAGGGGAPLKPVSSAASGASAASSSDNKSTKAFSAEDAKQSSGSLKDRIALLSGLKVDQPGAPGRPPKPWRKKTADPEELKEGDKQAGEDVVSPSSESIPSLSVHPGNESGLPASEKERDDDPLKATDSTMDKAVESSAVDTSSSSNKESLGVASEGEVKSSPGNSGVALPSMPTRTRGPPRKGRSGGTAAAPAPSAPEVTSPSSEEPVNKEEAASRPVATETRQTRTLADIGSPTAPPTDLDASTSKAQPTDRKHDAHTDESVSEPPRRSSTGPPSRSVPLPPPTSAAAADDEEEGEEEEEEEEQKKIKEESLRETVPKDQPEHTPTVVNDDRVSSIQTGLARQSLDDQELPSSPAKAMPPVPPRLDTQVSSASASVASPRDSAASPSPSLTNRRSMTRPPVPSGYSQASATPSSPSRSSFEAGSPRGSIVSSQRGSLLMSPSQPDVVTAEPFGLSADSEGLPRSSIDSSRERETSARSSMDIPRSSEDIKSPVRQDSAPLSPQRRQSTMSPVGGTAPARSASIASRSSYISRPEEDSPEQETNISAMRAHMSPPLPSEGDAGQTDKDAPDEEEEYEDPEVARRQALAKRMAAMGGMKIGMLPPMFGGAKKKKNTLPKEPEPDLDKALEAPLPSAPPPPPPASAPSDDEAETVASPPRPAAPKSTPSHRPPAGAFVLPSLGRPPAPPAPAEDNEQEEENEEDAAVDQQTPHAESEPVFETQADETVTQELVDEEEDAEAAPPPPPPPVPAGRPSRPPPPPGQSFIEDDTDTEGGISDKRTSLSSSAGVGSMPDFPAPPSGGGPHVRTQSSASRYSNFDAADRLAEMPEYVDEPGSYREEQPSDDAGPTPPRPARPPPPLDTTNLDRSGSYLSGGNAPSRQTSMAEPSSPSQSVHSFSQRSVPGTPASAHGRQGSFDPLSPTPSSGSGRRASMPPPGQQGMGGPPIQPGLNNQYLAHLATNAAKTKSREIDGALAHTLNDIAYTYRSDPASFGMPVWRTYVSGKGTPPDLQIHGRIEAGCVFLAWDAKFDRGLGRSSLKVGSAEVPHVGIIAESVKDIKKAKVKVVELVQGRHNVETYKLDDIKSGTVEIRRLN